MKVENDLFVKRRSLTEDVDIVHDTDDNGEYIPLDNDEPVTVDEPLTTELNTFDDLAGQVDASVTAAEADDIVTEAANLYAEVNKAIEMMNTKQAELLEDANMILGEAATIETAQELIEPLMESVFSDILTSLIERLSEFVMKIRKMASTIMMELNMKTFDRQKRVNFADLPFSGAALLDAIRTLDMTLHTWPGMHTQYMKFNGIMFAFEAITEHRADCPMYLTEDVEKMKAILEEIEKDDWNRNTFNIFVIKRAFSDATFKKEVVHSGGGAAEFNIAEGILGAFDKFVKGDEFSTVDATAGDIKFITDDRIIDDRQKRISQYVNELKELEGSVSAQLNKLRKLSREAKNDKENVTIKKQYYSKLITFYMQLISIQLIISAKKFSLVKQHTKEHDMLCKALKNK